LSVRRISANTWWEEESDGTHEMVEEVEEAEVTDTTRLYRSCVFARLFAMRTARVRSCWAEAPISIPTPTPGDESESVSDSSREDERPRRDDEGEAGAPEVEELV
jgi:hypothetical protein